LIEKSRTGASGRFGAQDSPHRVSSSRGLSGLPPHFDWRWSAWRAVIFMTLCLVIVVMPPGCKDRSRSSTTGRWDRIVEGQNNELYFVDRSAIERVSPDVVRIPVKYAPAKGQFLVSLQELSKQFGTDVQDVGQEYTVSMWEFSCTKPEGRCLGLSHFKKGSKIASYDYPDARWTPLDKAPSTKVVRDLVCAELGAPKK
jgi:hypothetical protein